MVLEGGSSTIVRRAVGRIPDAALSGQLGNIGLAGHRDTFVRALRGVHQNDDVILRTEQGTYRYRVETIEVVSPQRVDVLHTAGEPTLTLVTCHPFNFVGSARNRLVVSARAIQSAAG